MKYKLETGTRARAVDGKTQYKYCVKLQSLFSTYFSIIAFSNKMAKFKILCIPKRNHHFPDFDNDNDNYDNLRNKNIWKCTKSDVHWGRKSYKSIKIQWMSTDCEEIFSKDFAKV